MVPNKFFPYDISNVGENPYFKRDEYGDTKTPEWMISAGEIFSQTNSDSNYQKFSKCHSVETFLGHNIRDNVCGNFTSGGHIIAQDTDVVMPIGPYVTSIKTAIGNATKIDTIVAVRMSIVDSVLTPLQTMTFTTCYFTYLRQINDNIEFHFRFNKCDDEYAVIGQDGAVSGSKTSTIDLNQFKIG